MNSLLEKKPPQEAFLRFYVIGGYRLFDLLGGRFATAFL